MKKKFVFLALILFMCSTPMYGQKFLRKLSPSNHGINFEVRVVSAMAGTGMLAASLIARPTRDIVFDSRGVAHWEERKFFWDPNRIPFFFAGLACLTLTVTLPR